MQAVQQTTDKRQQNGVLANCWNAIEKMYVEKKNIKDIKDEWKNSVDIERRDQFYSGKCKWPKGLTSILFTSSISFYFYLYMMVVVDFIIV